MFRFVDGCWFMVMGVRCPKTYWWASHLLTLALCQWLLWTDTRFTLLPTAPQAGIGASLVFIGARVRLLCTYRDAFAAFSICTACCVTLPKPNPPSLGNLGT